MNFKNFNILYVIWSSATFLFYLYTLATQRCNTLKIYLINAAFCNCEFFQFIIKVQKLPKLPKHVALAFQYASRGNAVHILDNNNAECSWLDLKRVSKVTAWIAATGVETITLYDRRGVLKSRQASLQEEFKVALKTVMKTLPPDRTFTFPDIMWHCVNQEGKCTEIIYPGTKNSDQFLSRKKLNIFLCSYDDGKPKLLDMVRNAAGVKDGKVSMTGSENNNDCDPRVSKIDVQAVNEFLKRSCCEFLLEKGYQMEPDLLVSFGDTQSTLGFLPWHIRLTELHWLPHVNRMHPMQVLDVFRKYAKCEQRFGK